MGSVRAAFPFARYPATCFALNNSQGGGEMDFRDVTISALKEYKDALARALDGLTPIELRWQPSPSANHALWLAWHIARVEDRWTNWYVAGGEEVWTTDRWSERMGIPAEGNGYGATAEDVAGFPDVDIADVTAYHDAVREKVLPVIEGLSASDLEQSYGDRISRRREAPTVAWVLGHIAVEEAQHVGQIAYIRGMLRGLGG